MENLGLGKVLLVEDDEKLAGLIAHFLSQHGFEVRVVHRGDEALAAFLDFKPKIVVLDLMLPGQSGLHVCREIRSVSDTPIVILTAKEDDLDHILGLESGADDYVIEQYAPQGVDFYALRKPGSHGQLPDNLRNMKILTALPGADQVPASPAVGIWDRSGKLAYFGPYSEGLTCNANNSFIEPILKALAAGREVNATHTLAVGCYCSWPKGE